MPTNLIRHYGRGDLHFITFSCYHRFPLLGSSHARNTFVTSLATLRGFYSFLLVGYVVMPEHVHLLISEPPKSNPSSLLQILKQHVAHSLLTVKGDPERFWDHRFYDFNVYSARKRREKLEYMHMNPIKRGLVKNPRFWPWSSFLNYEKGAPGLIPIDFVD